MKRSLPQARKFTPPKNLSWDIAPQALERWTPGLVHAGAADETSTISILDPIGFDPWTGEGVTVKRIAAALRSIGPEQDVVVNINSPGGDLFEGLAIYSALREHKGQVTVKILGLAASAASIVAMAGDEVQISRAGFLMIHDTWVMAMGNRNDLRGIADTLEPFDRAMADIYAARSGVDAKRIGEMMDAETWFGASDAIDQGLADSMLPSDEVKKDKNARGERYAAHLLDLTLARAGMPRNERRQLLTEFREQTNKSGGAQTAAAGTAAQTADEGAQTAAKAKAETPTLEQPQSKDALVEAIRGFVIPSLN